VGVCSAGMEFCSRAEACSLSFSLIMLRWGEGGLDWPWVRGSLAYGPGVSVFLFFSVISLVGVSPYGWRCSLMLWPCAVSLCVAGSFTVFTVGCCYTVEWVFGLMCVAGSFTVW